MTRHAAKKQERGTTWGKNADKLLGKREIQNIDCPSGLGKKKPKHLEGVEVTETWHRPAIKRSRSSRRAPPRDSRPQVGKGTSPEYPQDDAARESRRCLNVCVCEARASQTHPHPAQQLAFLMPNKQIVTVGSYMTSFPRPSSASGPYPPPPTMTSFIFKNLLLPL